MQPARRILALVLIAWVSPGAVTAQGEDPLEPIIQRGGQARLVVEEANKWRLELVLSERRERGIPALASDDTVVREVRVRERLVARTASLISDIARTTGADAERIASLRTVLTNAAQRTFMQAQISDSGFDDDWVDRAWELVLDSEAWRLGQEKALTDEQRGALLIVADARAQRLLQSRTKIAVISLAAELRLRRPQVEQLEPLVAAWLMVRAPKRAEILAGDVVTEMLTVPHIREQLNLEQMMRLMRMRSARRAILLEDGAPGDDLGLGAGRYPEDDYALEICALASYHGWDWEELDVMRGAGEMLGRELRRARPRRWRNGDRKLTDATVDCDGDPLWGAVLERERKARGVTEPAPPPACTGVQRTFIDARTQFLTALLDERVLLSAEQRKVLPEQLEVLAKYEFRRTFRGNVALDSETNWRRLYLNEERNRGPRTALASALKSTLEPDQLIELGL